MSLPIRFEPVTTTGSPLYKSLEQLLVASFPTEEYRELEEQRRNTDEEPAFHTLAILCPKDEEEEGTKERKHGEKEKERFAGLLTYWQFDTFRYIEHFAICPDLRNKGAGHEALSHFCLHTSQPVILEAEPPTAPMACRRIAFYERHGFRLCPLPYLQPPYRPEGAFFPLVLMGYGEVSWEDEFESIRSTIYRKVYHN